MKTLIWQDKQYEKLADFQYHTYIVRTRNDVKVPMSGKSVRSFSSRYLEYK